MREAMHSPALCVPFPVNCHYQAGFQPIHRHATNEVCKGKNNAEPSTFTPISRANLYDVVPPTPTWQMDHSKCSKNEALPDLLSQLALDFEAIFPGAIASILLLDEAGKHILHGAAPSLPPDFFHALASIELGARAGSCGTSAYLGQTVWVSDITSDPLCSELMPIAAKHGLRGCWSAPILSRQERVIGTLALYFPESRVAQPGEALALERSAHLASLAIESSELKQDLLLERRRLSESQRVTKIGSWEIDLSNYRVTWSEESYRVWGVSPETFAPSYDLVISLIHPEDAALIRERNQTYLEGDVTGPVEFRVPWKDGTNHILCTRAELVRDEQNRPSRLIGTVQDITEQTLLETRLKLSDSALQSVPYGVVIADDKRNIIWTNKAFLTMSGYLSQEVLGQNCRLLQGPLTDKQTVKAIRFALKNKMQFTGEILNYRSDGNTFWNELKISPVRDSRGRYTHFVAVLQDITASKQAALLRLESEMQMEQLFQNSLSGMAITTLDGHFLKVNPSYCSTVGWSEAELLERSIKDITHPEDWGQNVDLIEEVLHGRAESCQMEKKYIHKDGQLVWALLHFFVVRDGAGIPIHLVGHVRDITQQKQQQKQIDASENRFRTAFENASVGMALMDLTGRALMINEAYASTIGYSTNELISKNLTLLLHPADLPEFNVLVEQILQDKTSAFKYESRLIHKDGRTIWIKSRVSLIRDENKLPLHLILLTEDVTERRSTQAEREQLLLSERAARSEADRANRLKSEFLSTLSHELRTPLNAILGWVELLQDGEDDPDTLAEGLGVISRNVRAQARLIDDLLELSRIESGQISLEVKQFDLAEVITAAVDAVDPAATDKEILILSELPVGETIVVGDFLRLQQVVWNLLTNAVKFTPENGCVVVSLKRLGAQAEIAVSDNGSGIRSDFLPHIFERFRQQNATTTRSQGGMGIGLALAKELVELHEGSIKAMSLGEDRGATFTVLLPLMANGAATTTLANSETPLISSTLCLQDRSILVIDDQEDTRILLGRILTARGAKVLSAASAMEGFRLLRDERPDLILSDIGMPIHDGYEFIKWVRALSPAAGGDTPAAAFTAFVRAEDREKALLSGYQMHITKPINPKQLLAAVLELAKTPPRA